MSDDGKAALYRLTNGYFQFVYGPDANGKTTTIIFSQLCGGVGCASYTTSVVP